MSLLVFAVVVLIVAGLLIAMVNYIPNLPPPLRWAIPLLVLLLAALLILNRAGVI